MLPLTKEQRVKVEENMGLVGKVIGDCVHTLDKGCIYTYDDLFQIGCIGLCKAAQTDQPGHKGAFSTYAYCLIRNEIYTQLEYATRRSREQATDPAELPCGVVDDSLEERDACRELMGLLDRAEATATGTTAKGIRAIRMRIDGYSSKEIGELLGAPANHVTAWVSKARKPVLPHCLGGGALDTPPPGGEAVREDIINNRVLQPGGHRGDLLPADKRVLVTLAAL